MIKGKSPIIGLLTEHSYYSIPIKIKNGIEDRAKELNVSLITFMCGGLTAYPMTKRQNIILCDLARQHPLDGLVIASNLIAWDLNTEEKLEFFKTFGSIPIVSAGHHLKGIPSITVDNWSGMYLEVEHFIKIHHKKKIAFITGPENNLEANERLSAYKKALEDNGIPFNPDLVLPGNFQSESGAAAIQLLLNT